MLSFLTQRIGPLEKLMQILLLHLGQRSYVVARLRENICWSSTEGWETKRERQSEIQKNWEKNFLHNFRHIPHRWWSCGGTLGLESRRARGSSLVGQCLYGNRVWSNGSKKHGKNNTRTRQTSSSVMISRLKRERKPLWKDFSSSSDQNQPRPIPSFQEAPRKAFPRAALFWSADRYLAKTL